LQAHVSTSHVARLIYLTRALAEPCDGRRVLDWSPTGPLTRYWLRWWDASAGKLDLPPWPWFKGPTDGLMLRVTEHLVVDGTGIRNRYDRHEYNELLFIPKVTS